MDDRRQLRRAPLRAPRRLPREPQPVRGPVDRRGGSGVRTDAGPAASGLRPQPTDHRLGLQPARHQHPPAPAHQGGAEEGRRAGGRGPPTNPAGCGRGPAPGSSTRHRPGAGPGGPPVAVRERRRRQGLPAAPLHRGRGPARAGVPLDPGGRRGRVRRPRPGHRAPGPRPEDHPRHRHPLRLGQRTQPQRRQRHRGHPDPARRHRTAGSAGRRLRHVQHRALVGGPGGGGRRRAAPDPSHRPDRGGPSAGPGRPHPRPLRLQLQPSGHPARARRGAPRPGPRGPVHSGLRAGHDRHRPVGGRGPARHHLPGAPRGAPRLRQRGAARPRSRRPAGRPGAQQRLGVRRAGPPAWTGARG